MIGGLASSKGADKKGSVNLSVFSTPKLNVARLSSLGIGFLDWVIKVMSRPMDILLYNALFFLLLLKGDYSLPCLQRPNAGSFYELQN